MYDDSPKRFDRIVAILIQLQSRKIVKAQDMADRFEVSLRTIYRDIRTLEVAGVPIYSEAGIGYSLMDGYRLPPVMFSREEATSFIAAEKLMQRFTDPELRGHYESAMFKLKAVLRSADKDWISAIESKIHVTPRNHAPNALASIFRSVAEKIQTQLLYQALEADEPTERLIEPVGVYHEGGHWYVFAFCHLRKDYRQFRTDRIHQIKLTEISFSESHLALEHYLPGNETDGRIKIRILVDKSIVKYIREDRKHYGFVSETMVGNEVEMTFLSRDSENGFLRWYMMFADYAKILEPDSVKERVRELLELGLKKL